MKEKQPIEEVNADEQQLEDERMVEMIQNERDLEHANEVKDAMFDCWFDDHNTALKEDYIEQSFDEFMEYCREQYKEESA